MAPTIDEEVLLRRPLYVFDLPPELINTLQPKFHDDLALPNKDLPTSSDVTPDAHSRNASPSIDVHNGENGTAISCSMCGVTFNSVQEQRSHVRSDLHGYNMRMKLRGLNPVNEITFEKIVGELDESISGSEASSSDPETETDERGKIRGSETVLSALLKKQANLEETDGVVVSQMRKQGSGKPPLVWFKSSLLLPETSLGIYRAIFTNAELQGAADPVSMVRKKQLSSAARLESHDSEGGVRLAQAHTGPHIFLCMVGGGHFAGMIISLTPKIGKKQGADERQATVLAHKTFHRYTTRRKQGGAQSANDAAKGNAHSAGSSLRRYNEAALESEIRALLTDWKDLIHTSELLFVRATGTTNRRTLFGPYEGQVLRQDDPRNRSFPFSTRRATQAELMRSFTELTRVKISRIDEAALEATRIQIVEDDASKVLASSKPRTDIGERLISYNAEDQAALLHTTQLEALMRRFKAPAVLSYLAANSLSPDFTFFPSDTPAHHHAPTVLHLASSLNSPALVTALLVKGGANPTVTSAEGKTAFDIAGDRSTRDAFRLARSDLGDDKWRWQDAHVPDPLTKTTIDERNQREKEELAKQEELRRRIEMDRIREEDRRKEQEQRKAVDERREKTIGKGRRLNTPQMTAEERREEESRGMTPEMKMRLEREKRARAAEERLRKTQGGA